MTGIIVTGHAQFAEGVTSSLNLIAGKQQNYDTINYDGGSTEEYTKKLRDKVDEMFLKCENVLILTDLTGGTPFQMSALMTQELNNVRVVGGINVGFLIEVSMMRNIEEDIDALLETVIEHSRESMSVFNLDNLKTSEEPSDGI